MKSKRVFVSGGAGVIGLEMIPRLVKNGATVFVGDLKSRPKEFPAKINYRQGDLNFITGRDLEIFAPDVFIHLAATFERSTETYGFWEENFWHNLRLSHHLMTLAKDLPTLKRVVFASSYLIYDPDQYQFDEPQLAPVSLDETDSILPRNLTGMAKLAHEVELRFLSNYCSASFTTVCARIFRGYGKNSRDVISRWVRALLAEESISVYRPEGLFDFIYSKDTADGLIRLADECNVTGVINLGTGTARRVQEIVDILRKYFPNMQVVEKEAEIPFEASQADMSRNLSKLGWSAEYDLERAIPEIIAYEKTKMKMSGKLSKELEFGHVLVTSASKKVAMIQAVQQAGKKVHPDILVIAGDMEQNALTRYVADQFWLMPKTDDTEVDALLAGCKARGIRIVIPTRDGELLFWARHQKRFAEEGIEVVVSPLNSVEICVDKYAFAEFGKTHGFFSIPTGSHPDEIGEAPYVVKERYGAGARKIGINLGRNAALKHGKMLETPIYQSFVVGKEISVDAWMDRFYQVKGLVLRTRDRVVNGESQITTTFRDPDIEVQVVDILKALKLRGPIVLQALVDDRKNLHVIECNARFGGASTISIEVGLDIFYWSFMESYGVDMAQFQFNRMKHEIRQVRVPTDVYIK